MLNIRNKLDGKVWDHCLYTYSQESRHEIANKSWISLERLFQCPRQILLVHSQICLVPSPLTVWTEHDAVSLRWWMWSWDRELCVGTFQFSPKQSSMRLQNYVSVAMNNWEVFLLVIWSSSSLVTWWYWPSETPSRKMIMRWGQNLPSLNSLNFLREV